MVGDNLNPDGCNNVTHNLILKRNPLYFGLAKALAWPFVKSTSHKHYDIPKKTLDLMAAQKKNKDVAIYYVAPHKSLWETVAIPYAISWHGGDMPFIMMGNNLVKPEDGWKERWLFKIITNSGVIPIERKRTAVQIMIDDVTKVLSHNLNLLIFAEGTRARDGIIQDFKPAGFEGLARAVAAGTEAYIVPVNVDYSNMIEIDTFAAETELNKFKILTLSEPFHHLAAAEKIKSMRDMYHQTNFVGEKIYSELEAMVSSESNNYNEYWKKLLSAHKFNVRDSSNWKVFIDDVYLSFGEPIYVEHKNDREYRGELAKVAQDRCKGLVKIQKNNVLSEAILRMNVPFSSRIYTPELHPYIADVLEDLRHAEDKFRGFTMDTPVEEIISGAKMSIDSRDTAKYQIYANQTGHYLKK